MRIAKQIRSVLSFAVAVLLLLQHAVFFADGAHSAAPYVAHGAQMEITVSDVLKILLVCVNIETAEVGSPLFLAVDLDYDGRITSADARLLLRSVEAAGAGDPNAIRLDQLEMRYTDLSGHVMKYVETSAVDGYYLYPGPFYQCAVCGQRFTDAYGKERVLPDYLSSPVSGTLAQVCNEISAEYRASGVQAAVIRNGCVTNTYTYGIADRTTGRALNEDTKYRIASLTKLVTAMVFMCLVDEGLVGLNDDISVYFGYTCRNPHFPDTVITPHMLLTHTASFDCEGYYELSDQTLAKEDMYLYIEPGTETNYSNIGYAVLGCICENVTGAYLDDLAAKYIFEPLGIDASYLAYKLKDPANIAALYGEEYLSIAMQLSQRERPLGLGLTLAQGNLMISAKDFAKILCVFLNGGLAPDGARILSENSIALMEAVWTQDEGTDLGYGMYRQTDVFANKVVYTHTGSAYGMFSAYLFSPEDRAGVVVLTSGCARLLDEDTQIYSVCLDFIHALYPE